MWIICTAIVLFGFTTIMGLYLSSLVLRNKKTVNLVIVIHGVCTITGFILLFTYYPESLKSIVSFSIATFFGLILLYQDIMGKKFSKWLCFVHAFFTIVGFVFLLMFASQL